MNNYLSLLDEDKSKWLVEQLFVSMGFCSINTRRPFRMLTNFQFESEDNICGSETIGCALSAYYTQDDEYYIGENKVTIIDDVTDEQIIMDELDFYPYIEKYSMEYIKNNPEVKEEVVECLNNIRRRFKLA